MRHTLIDDAVHLDTEPSERRVYSVAEITREIKVDLENRFPALWVEGEISNFKRHASGHLYFSLKDAEAQIACVMWRGRNQNLRFQPQDGMKVLAFGDVTVYERQGKYQLDTAVLRPSGVGDLQLAFEALKKKLAAEGLFDEGRKRPIPAFPERIGIVTSPAGAAVHDIVSIVSRRFPAVQLILRPVRVQGDGAAEEIALAIGEFNEYGEADVLIVGRGGGSMEDLWAFNEEPVARAVSSSRIPVVSAVGHEVDFTICDFVADLRAPTPSAAAELVVPDRTELLSTLRHWTGRAVRLMGDRLRLLNERVQAFDRSHALQKPSERLRERRFRVDDMARRCEALFERRILAMKAGQEKAEEKLAALSPGAVLRRGYSITTRVRDGRVVTGADEVAVDEFVRIRLSRGEVEGRVERILLFPDEG
jgi:exodeoxyribonuclease VII large subunit